MLPNGCGLVRVVNLHLWMTIGPTCSRKAMLRVMQRLRTARMRDVRLWCGLALIAVSMLAGARILSDGRDTVTVWQVTRDLQTGATPTGLVAVEVNRDIAGSTYLEADRPASAAGVAGTLRWPISSGQLLPKAALTDDRDGDVRLVPVPVDPRHLPPDVQAGDAVDVWTTDVQERTSPRLVIAQVLVSSVSSDPSGVASELTVMLRVPTNQVQDVVAASRVGSVDLVSVPISSTHLVQDPRGDDLPRETTAMGQAR